MKYIINIIKNNTIKNNTIKINTIEHDLFVREWSNVENIQLRGSYQHSAYTLSSIVLNIIITNVATFPTLDVVVVVAAVGVVGETKRPSKGTLCTIKPKCFL